MIKITKPTEACLGRAQKLYIDSFPPEERRPWGGVVEPESAYGPVLHIVEDAAGAFAGLVTVWEFDTFRYVEHFAVDPSLRGSGIGSEVLEALRGMSAKPLLLEVERPDDANPMAARRIGFYSRNGFALLDYDYIQPPYAEGLPEVPLLLMSTDPALEPAAAAATLHRCVYGAGGEAGGEAV